MAAQLGEVDQIEGRDAGPDPVELHPGQAAALPGQLEQAFAFENFHHQAGILEVVGHQGLGFLLVEAGDLRRSIGRLFVDEFAPSEDRVGDGAQAVVGQTQGVTHQGDAIDHHASADFGSALPGKARIALKANSAGKATQGRFSLREPQGFEALGEHPKIEVHHVPPQQEVGVEFANSLGQGHQ